MHRVYPEELYNVKYTILTLDCKRVFTWLRTGLGHSSVYTEELIVPTEEC